MLKACVQKCTTGPPFEACIVCQRLQLTRMSEERASTHTRPSLISVDTRLSTAGDQNISSDTTVRQSLQTSLSHLFASHGIKKMSRARAQCFNRGARSSTEFETVKTYAVSLLSTLTGNFSHTFGSSKSCMQAPLSTAGRLYNTVATSTIVLFDHDHESFHNARTVAPSLCC